VKSTTDQQLLRDYSERRAEAAFGELVRRHVDLVYSAALRMVRDAHLAQDVTQGAFLALAQNASQLADRPVLSGWLHRTAQNLAVKVVRSEVRRRAREQEAATLNALLADASDATWDQIATHLDAALGELSEPDRDAVMLRFFEGKTAQEMAQTLRISDEAAQKRVSRAVDRLREGLAKRGLAAGAAGLAALITANAVEAAPAGLVVTISGAANALIAAAQTTSALATTTKAIAMTTLQKTLFTAALVAAIGAGVYEARQASNLRKQNQALQQQEEPLAGQILQLQREREQALTQLAGLRAESERWKSSSNESELLGLRGEVGMLRQQTSDLEKQNQALREARKPDLPVFSTNLIPRGTWGFAGFATPEAAVQSSIWAKSVGEIPTFLASMAPDITNAFARGFAQNSAEEISRHLSNDLGNVTGFQILNQVPLSDDEALVQVLVQAQTNGVPQQGDTLILLKKIGGEWKGSKEYNSPEIHQLP
jgi:RNA polymerase sigma factor (sigma-70 family)